jgi:pilus assembly protein CpaC
LAGGEFPVPVPQSGGAGGGGSTITVEYKQFGVQMAFTPVVLGNGRVRLEVKPEVSDLDYSRSVSFQGFVIPTITKRTLETTVEMNEGQTFAVAGLLHGRTVANRDGTPLLADIPVLGALFRSTRYERSETELVVLVTPYIVEAMNPDQVPTLPGERWRFPNEADLVLGTDLGGEAPDTRNAPKATDGGPAAAPARYRGQYGFSPAK